MRLVYKIVTPIAFLLFILTACSSKQSDKSAKLQDPKTPFDSNTLLKYDLKKENKKIDEVMQNLHKTRGFNGNVLVAKNDKIIYEKAIGWADYMDRDSLNINSTYELASVKISITSSVMGMLPERGKLKLDD